jgi:hypothetical protein
MSREEDAEPVGYKRPPKHSQFKKGRSGNPSGRRKAKPQLNLIAELIKLMAEPIPVVKKGKPQTVSLLVAFLRSTLEAAFKGDSGARKDVINLLKLIPQASDGDTSDLTSEQEAQLLSLFLARQPRSDGGYDG